MLWAITCYFNPAGYQSRAANYRTFRKHLAVPLLTVELSFTGSFELEPDAADVLVQLSGGDVLWQKERLLNLALRRLPDDCDIVAWVDCDVLFSDAYWPQQAREALNSFALIQLFSERLHLARNARRGPSGWGPIESRRQAIGHALAGDGLKPEELSVGGSFRHGPLSTGLAWAARRTLLDKCGFYDARIVGGGDAAMVWAALGRPDHSVIAQSMSGRAAEHYRAWAEPFFAEVGGRVGYLPGPLFHLWHGSYAERRHKERQQDITALGFDPFTDLALDDSACWRWNSDKPELHRYVRNYFTARNEDGCLSPESIG